MLHAKLVISSLHELCIFWISFCQPFLTPHHHFLFNHPTTWLVLTVPYRVQFGLCCLNLCQWGHCWSAVKTSLHCNTFSFPRSRGGNSYLKHSCPSSCLIVKSCLQKALLGLHICFCLHHFFLCCFFFVLFI